MKMWTKALKAPASLKKLYESRFFAFVKFNETRAIYTIG
ncbi:hypothetical protein FORMB_16260 [Formosa sp. Hel1_33_131]|nr:hypothetical protein FORMB_16260 [Formosa sp. Hel1_33_131]